MKFFGSSVLERRFIKIMRIDGSSRKRHQRWLVRQMVFFCITLISLILLLQTSHTPSAHAAQMQSQSSLKPAVSTAARLPPPAVNTVTVGGSGVVCETSGALKNIQDCITVDAPYTGGSYQVTDQKVYNPLSPKSTLYFITPLEATANNALVQSLWSSSLALVDVLMVIVLMLQGLKIMIAGSIFRYSDAVEGLPNILIALIAAHVSFIFIGFFLGLNNTVSGDLYSWVNSSATFQGLAQKEEKQHTTFDETVHLPRDPTGIHDPELPTSGSCVITKVAPELTPQRVGGMGGFGGITIDVQVPGSYVISWDCNGWTVTTSTDDISFIQEVVLKNYPTGVNDPQLLKYPPANSQIQGRTCARTSIRLASAGRVGITDHYLLQWTCVSLLLTPTDLNFTNTDLGSIMANWGNIIPILIQVMGVMVIGQVVIRLFFLNLYIALAPLCLACWALPGKTGQPVTRLWLTGFISTALVQFLQVVALVVISFLGQLFLATYSQPLGAVIDISLLRHVIQLMLLWLIIQIPGLLNAAPMRTLVEAGQAATQAVSASVGAQIGIVQAGAQVGTTMLQDTVGAAQFFTGML